MNSDRVARPIRVLVVDAHPMAIRGLSALIRETEGLELAGSAATPEEALQVARETQPDVITLEIRLRQADGLELVPDLRRAAPDARILVCSGFVHRITTVERILNAGVDGCVSKEEPIPAIAAAIRAVATTHHVYSDRISEIIFEALRRGRELRADADRQISPDQQILLQLVGEGLTTEEIAQHLNVSRTTVARRLHAAYQALGAANRAEAIARAITLRLLPVPGDPPSASSGEPSRDA